MMLLGAPLYTNSVLNFLIPAQAVLISGPFVKTVIANVNMGRGLLSSEFKGLLQNDETSYIAPIIQKTVQRTCAPPQVRISTVEYDRPIKVKF